MAGEHQGGRRRLFMNMAVPFVPIREIVGKFDHKRRYSHTVEGVNTAGHDSAL